MISPTLRRAYRFFLEHAGYATPPGKAACALRLAKAERWMHDAGLYALWVLDDDADLSWMDDAERRQPHDIEGCILVKPCQYHTDREDYSYETYRACSSPSMRVRRGEGCEQLQSLWSIVDASSQYRRVVEAELALDAMPAHPPLPRDIIAEVRP